MKKSCILLLSTFLFSTVCLRAQTWNGSASSDWNTASNWTPATVPGSGSSVTINNASATHQPVLSGDIAITSLTMSQGTLDLNNHSLTCSGNATFSGGTLTNGKVAAGNFIQMGNMRLNGKIVFDKTGSGNNFWDGGNKSYGDSLIIIWRSGTLHLENAASSPDSIFSEFKIQLANNNSTVLFSLNSLLYVKDNLILDNSGNGNFNWKFSNGATMIGQNLIGQNFSKATPDLGFVNITTSGDNENGPFYSQTASVNNCIFNGNFNLVADSNVTMNIHNSSLLGTNNLFQAGSLDVQNSIFGKTGSGTTILRAAHNLAASVLMRDGNNKFYGNVNFETYALAPGGITIQQNFYGVDSCWGNMSYILKGNSALTTNGNGPNYVAGNVIIDGQGARKWVQFTGGAGNTFNVGGSFTVKNFTRFAEEGVGNTNVHLRNLYVAGTDTVGTFYCYSGDITNSTFNGNFKLIADSSQGYTINYSSFLGADNLFQSGTLDFHDNKFGQNGNGTTILRAAATGNTYVRDGLNKFFGNVQWETYAHFPVGVTIQQNFYGADSCWGNVSYILKGNSALTTNGNGPNYVAGNVIIDGQGARKWVQFTGGAGNTFNVGGSFTVKNFTRFAEEGVGNTNVHLRNLYVAGTDTVGTFYCTTGDVNGSSFNGNFNLIGDSSQTYFVSNSSFSGENNFFQAGIVESQNNKFGKVGAGTTILKAAHNIAGAAYMRDGNNTFFGDAEWIAVAPSSGSIIIQQTFFGADTCLGNVTINLSGPSSANLGGANLYIGKGLSLVNNGSGVIVHDNGNSALYFTGADTANYSYSGSGAVPSLQNIGINRRGGLRLMSPLTCSGLILNRGIILSSSTNPMKLPNGAVVVGGGDSSYVDGPMTKTGNNSFTFPLGKNNIYAPISITAPALTTDAFTAQYFDYVAQHDGYDSTSKDVSLNHLSRSEYWMLNRSAGSSPVKVTLSWKTSRSGSVTSMNDLRVAHWNGSIWKDEGNGGTLGSNSEGTIQSVNTINSFSPFTLASINAGNALPLRYISFDAQIQKNRTVLLQWKTADEINNDHFEVERSKDGNVWVSLASIAPQFSHEYSYTDVFPEDGLNYYRIKETDVDDRYFYSNIQAVRIGKSSVLNIWPNPASDILFIEIPFTGGTVTIHDMSGKLIGRYINTHSILAIPVKELKAGVYIVKAESGKEKFMQKFVKE